MVGKPPFSEDTKLKCLLWSARHCCVCGKDCGLDIEIAHIDPEGGNDIDNAIPVCYTHHAKIGRYVYDKEHPRGNKYRMKELKQRRNQIYEEHTRHLVPTLVYHLKPEKRDRKLFPFQLPRVGFLVKNHSAFLHAKFKVNVITFLGGEKVGRIVIRRRPYYSGDMIWHVNAGHQFWGNFRVQKKCVASDKELIAEIQVTAIDPYDRPHDLPPICYRYVRNEKYWLPEPTSFSELKKYMDNPSTE